MLHAVCSVRTPKSVRRRGMRRDLNGVGEGEKSEERWERSRSKGDGMRGGEKWRGNGSTVSKRRWEMLQRRWRWENIFTY